MLNKKKITKKIALSLLGISLFSTGVLTNINESSRIYAKEIKFANESIQLKNAKSKIVQLTKSLKTNYLGIKNQGTWEIYIKEARELINEIPNSEKLQRDALAVEVDKNEALVRALSRINQVEKSTTPKEQGGYGNHLGIKNAETWLEYLRLAEIDLKKVDRQIFEEQYDELVHRKHYVEFMVVSPIKQDFQVEYARVARILRIAREIGDINGAKLALSEAEKLGTCEASDNMKKDIKKFIENDNDALDNILNKVEKELKDEIDSLKIKISGKEYTLAVSYLNENQYLLEAKSGNDIRKYHIDSQTTDRTIVYNFQVKPDRSALAYSPILQHVLIDEYNRFISSKNGIDKESVKGRIFSLDQKRKICYAEIGSDKYEKIKYVIPYDATNNTLNINTEK